ncbi:MAG: ribosome assembly cofactor RimP [Prevotellaceae bacterium]|jgi:ribosome maturation factor RimP|nr:ribosome assembly cofactor RimP [Prevotellaceae bacterium]
MIEKKDIQPIIDNYTTGEELFLVSLKISADNVVEVVIDGPQGVNLGQCVALSNRINAAFDRDVDDFELTVSSAGLDQPLCILPQYLKYIGQEVEITLNTGRKLPVTLLDATPDTITVEYIQLRKIEGTKRKQTVHVTETYMLTEIKTTKPIIRWKD